mmetsp:Transcript_24992/g.54352  ORF Transcript_24992/g.54352 Transcript_24992/m.54352 type:complete len:201 (+) Transcript_24992:678-1280(+)
MQDSGASSSSLLQMQPRSWGQLSEVGKVLQATLQSEPDHWHRSLLLQASSPRVEQLSLQRLPSQVQLPLVGHSSFEPKVQQPSSQVLLPARQMHLSLGPQVLASEKLSHASRHSPFHMQPSVAAQMSLLARELQFVLHAEVDEDHAQRPEGQSCLASKAEQEGLERLPSSSHDHSSRWKVPVASQVPCFSPSCTPFSQAG